MSSGLFKLVGSIIGIGRNKQEAQAEDVRHQTAVSTVLNQAIITRTRMDLQVAGEETRSRPMRGVCVAITSTALLIDVNLTAPVNAWIGQKTHVYFRLKHEQGEEFYDFSVPIIGLPKHGDGYALQLQLPTEFNHNQKRMFVRLKPPAELIAELVLWRLPEDRDQPKNFSHLREAFCAGDPSIEDISGGGVRLGMNPLDPVVDSFSAGAIGIMHLVARERKDEEETLNLWLVCECVFIRSDNDSQKISLSFKFRKWAKEPVRGEDFTWLPIRSTEGVPSLTAWIVRQQLDATRVHPRI